MLYEVITAVLVPFDRGVITSYSIHYTKLYEDPYQVITWTPPQGGEGPDYDRM